MDTLIHVDFTRRCRTPEPHPEEDDILEQVVSTYLSFHPEATRRFVREMILQGLMFHRSLVGREPASVAT